MLTQARALAETATGQRGDRVEVTLIECQEPRRPETVRQDHHRKIRQPEIKVGVLLIEPRHRAVLISGQSLNPEPPRGHSSAASLRSLSTSESSR
ncbi:MAG: hypothetical protein ACRDOH_03920 [Streptosporangiaceae bacterium]